MQLAVRHASPFGWSVPHPLFNTIITSVCPPFDYLNQCTAAKQVRLVRRSSFAPDVSNYRMILVCIRTGSILLNQLDQTSNLFILDSVAPDSLSPRIVCPWRPPSPLYPGSRCRLWIWRWAGSRSEMAKPCIASPSPAIHGFNSSFISVKFA